MSRGKVSPKVVRRIHFGSHRSAMVDGRIAKIEAKKKRYFIFQKLEDIQVAGVISILISCAVGSSLRTKTLYSEMLSLGI